MQVGFSWLMAYSPVIIFEHHDNERQADAVACIMLVCEQEQTARCAISVVPAVPSRWCYTSHCDLLLLGVVAA